MDLYIESPYLPKVIYTNIIFTFVFDYAKQLLESNITHIGINLACGYESSLQLIGLDWAWLTRTHVRQGTLAIYHNYGSLIAAQK